MDINFHAIDNILGLQVVGDLGAQFPFLGEQIFEKYDNRGLHLLEYVFIDDLFGYFVPGARVASQDVYF